MKNQNVKIEPIKENAKPTAATGLPSWKCPICEKEYPAEQQVVNIDLGRLELSGQNTHKPYNVFFPETHLGSMCGTCATLALIKKLNKVG